MAGWRRFRGEDAEISVRLTPGASRDRIDGVRKLADGRGVLAARVRAVPESGEANRALERLVAAVLGIAPGRVRVTAGRAARIKTVHIAGGAREPAAALAALAANGEDEHE